MSESEWQTDVGAIATSPVQDHLARRAQQIALDALTDAFLQPFALVSVESGDIVHADSEGLNCDLFGRAELLAEVVRRGQPEIIEDVAPLSLLAIPLDGLKNCSQLVAVGVFVHQQVDAEEEIAAASRVFGIDARRALRWTKGREVWPLRALLQLAKTMQEGLVQREQVIRLREEINDAVAHARDAYLELGLLHRITRHLHLSESQVELWQNVLEWLSDSVQAQCLAIVANETDPDISPILLAEEATGVLIHGECPTDKSDLPGVIKPFGAQALRQPLVLNRTETSLPTWHHPTIRELVSVPICAGNLPLGWLLALNHKGSVADGISSFGSVEIRLLSSVGTILGIHTSNMGLYKRQADLFASSVKSLTSAIDAKDNYTSGHSDRVAQLSVSLAERLGLDKQSRDTIYLGGLLHDIGKIGVDDQVLNKPGKLTNEEFEQIKLHPQLGYDILKGVRQLEKVLPCVLHHHEAWNGQGYPKGLKGTETPLMARIMAVADAFDAMSSDRPYRKGMQDEKLDAILREGAGSQWDPKVVEAFFDICEEFRKVARSSQRSMSRPQVSKSAPSYSSSPYHSGSGTLSSQGRRRS